MEERRGGFSRCQGRLAAAGGLPHARYDAGHALHITNPCLAVSLYAGEGRERARVWVGG